MASSVTLTKSGPGLAQIAKDLDRLKHSEVLVGIPAVKTGRKGDPINNAQLLFLHTNGSPLQNIPARPVLEPAIKANFKLIEPQLQRAAKQVLQRHPVEADVALQRAGTIAVNVSKRWFTDPRNGWQPNKPSTIAAKGSDRPLIDTGQLRRALTFVVRIDK